MVLELLLETVVEAGEEEEDDHCHREVGEVGEDVHRVAAQVKEEHDVGETGPLQKEVHHPEGETVLELPGLYRLEHLTHPLEVEQLVLCVCCSLHAEQDVLFGHP